METEKHEKGDIKKQTNLSLKRQMIIRVCRFLSEEYNFVRLHNVDNCKLAPLVGIGSRTAQATGVTRSHISRICAPYKERDAALSSHSGLSTKHARQKRRVTKEAIDTIPVLKDIKTEPNSDSDEDRATTKPLLHNAYAIKQESADNEQEIPCIEQEMPDIKQETLDIKHESSDNEKEIPSFEPEMPDLNQQILHIKQKPSDNEQERPIIAQEIKQNIQDINQESSDNKQETSSIKQETLYIKQEMTVNELGEGNTEIDFEKEIDAKILVIEELKMEKLLSSAGNLRNAKDEVKTNFMQLHRLYVTSKNNKKSAILLGTAHKTKLIDHGRSSSNYMEQAEYRVPPVTKQYAAKNGKVERIHPIIQQNLQLEDTENTHRTEIGAVTDLNQKGRLSYTFMEQEHEIPPGCPNLRQPLLFDNEVTGENTESNLDQFLQVDDDAEQQKKEENDLLPSNKFEANVVEVAKFEDEQEFGSVSYMEQDCYKLLPKLKKVDAMIARVYLFIKDEYQFMKMYNADNCNLSPLHSCTQRAAKATGVCLNYVKNAVGRTKALQQKKQLNTATYPQLQTYKPSKKRKQDDCNIITDNKTIKLNINIDHKDSDTNMAGSHTSNSTIIDISDKVNVDNATDINREAGYPKTSTWTEKEEHKMLTGVCSVTDINQKMGLSTFTEQEHEMPPVSRNLREPLQFVDEIKEEITETFNINNSTYNTQEIDLPSTCIKQEEYEMLTLSNRYTENDEDEGLNLSPNQAIKQEENEITPLYKTYVIYEQGVAHSRHLNQILQVDAEHLTSTKKVENDSLPSDKFATNVIGVVKFEEEQEVEAVSYMEQDCYKLEPKLEKVDISETSVSEQFIFYDNLPSSSRNNNDIIAKANETEDIEFVCIKNEIHSDSSHE